MTSPDQRGAVREISTGEARKQLAELLNRVAYGKETMVVTRHGRGVAALVPLEDLALIERVKRGAGAREMRKALRELESGETRSWSELRRELGL